MRTGYIYVITNLLNGKQYVGQTSRDPEVRFSEHCYDKRSTSFIHRAIVKYGVSNFKLEILEQPELNQLDEKEKEWIAKLDTYHNGYNKTEDGQGGGEPAYPHCQVCENNLVFDSKEDMARIMSEITSWSVTFLKEQFNRIIDTNKTFCDFHIISIPHSSKPVSDIIDQENWIKTLSLRFQGKRIQCVETEQEFDTIGMAAKYFVDNNLYQGSSKMPIQDLITSIGYNIKGKTAEVSSLGGLHFVSMPGTTKNKGGDFKKKPIYCLELDKTFESGVSAAEYFIENKIWKNITLKTARLRISDVVRGVFPEYKGYHFEAIKEN